MLDIGWSELILIGIVALIVVGPKDLPRMFHALGRMTAKARGMAREFQRAMDDAAKSTGLDEVRKDLNAIRNSTSPSAMGIDRLENAASKFEKWDPAKGVKAAAATANPTLAKAPVVTTAAPVVVPNMPAVTPAVDPSVAAPAETAAATGPATTALAEQKAAEQAAARQKALELQAKRTETAAKKFAEKAAEKTKAEAAEAAAQPSEPEPATEAAAAPVAEPPKAKPARKPPARRKKSDA